jgi:hypothetical protein
VADTPFSLDKKKKIFPAPTGKTFPLVMAVVGGDQLTLHDLSEIGSAKAELPREPYRHLPVKGTISGIGFTVTVARPVLVIPVNKKGVDKLLFWLDGIPAPPPKASSVLRVNFISRINLPWNILFYKNAHSSRGAPQGYTSAYEQCEHE